MYVYVYTYLLNMVAPPRSTPNLFELHESEKFLHYFETSFYMVTRNLQVCHMQILESRIQ